MNLLGDCWRLCSGSGGIWGVLESFGGWGSRSDVFGVDLVRGGELFENFICF